MAYETDEARDAARQRLQARMERRGTPQPQATRASARAVKAAPSIPPIAFIAAGVMLAVGLIIIAVTQCARIAPADANEPAPAGDQRVPVATIDANNEAQRKLIDIIGEDDAKKLLKAAATDADVLWIAAHPDAFAFDGVEVQAKVLKLAANEPASIPYVRAFPSQYPTTKPSDDSSLAMSKQSPSGDVPDTSVPHLYQWDRRWGYTTYSSAAFGLTGCGPTSMAMVVEALTGKETNPCDIAKLVDDLGYMDQFNGTGLEFFTEAADELGLECTQLYPTGDSITEALATGQVVVANLGPGQFTSTGHYFVLAGLDNWNVIVNDPYSVERSSRTWDPETIADESITLFAYSAQEKDQSR